MDPLSITSAIGGLVTVCGRVITTCRDIVTSFQDAPRILSSIQTECSTTREALSHIFMLINKTETIAITDLSSNTLLSQSFNIALTGCTITFSALDIELEKILGSSKNGQVSGLHQRAKFVWNEDVLNAVMEELRGQRDALNLLVTVVQSHSIAEVLELLKAKSAIFQDVKRRTNSLHGPTLDNNGQMVNDSWDSDSYSIFTEHTEKKFFDFDSDVLKSRAYKRVYSSVRSAHRPRRSQKNRSVPIANLLDEDDLIDLRDHPPLKIPYSLELEKELSPIPDHTRYSFNTERTTTLDTAKSTSDAATETISRVSTSTESEPNHQRLPPPHSGAAQVYGQADSFEASRALTRVHLPISDEKEVVPMDSDDKELAKSELTEPVPAELPTTSQNTMAFYLSDPIDLPRNPHSFVRAAASGKSEKIRSWLLQPKQFDSDILQEALLSASSQGHDDVVEMLLLRGVDVNCKLSEGLRIRNGSHQYLTPLHLAAASDKSSTVELLLKCGGDVSSTDSLEWTPLHLAAARGCIAAIRTLLRHQAPLESKALLTFQAQALNRAIMVSEHSYRARGLLDLVSWTPLFVATHSGALDAVMVLLESGADADNEPASGFTLLHAAMYEDSRYNILGLGETPTGHWSKRSICQIQQLSNNPLQSPRHVALLEYLVQKGFDPLAPDAFGDTPLHLACLYNIDLARALITHVKNVSPKSELGWTPLHVAALWSSDAQLAQLLIEAGADLEAPLTPPRAPVTVKDETLPDDSFLKWLTPLGLAVAKGYYEMAVHLLQMGAKAQMPTLDGASVLCISAAMNNPAMLVLLSKQGIGFKKAGLHDVGIAELPAIEHSNSAQTFFRKRLLHDEEEQPTADATMHGLENQFASDTYLPENLRIDVDAHDQHGNTPLMRVVQVVDDAAVRTTAIMRLLALGANPRTSDNDGRHLLHYSAKLETDEIRRLFKAGADLDAKDHFGQTPLLQLLPYGKQPVKIEYLIALGANIYAKDGLGRSAWAILSSFSKSKATRFGLNSISSLSRSDLSEDNYRSEVRKILNKAKKARPPPSGWVE